jgi:ribosomal protein L29
MKIKELDRIKSMSIEEIHSFIENMRKGMFELRMKKMIAPIKNVHLLRGMRKDLAAMLTILTSKVKGANGR